MRERNSSRAGERGGRTARASPWALVATLAVAALVGGCASIVRPNYSTELAELRAGDYELDPDHAYLLFRVEHLGLSTVVGRFDEVDATLDFDPADLASLRLDGVVAVASIDLDAPDLERRLRGREWLDAENHPEARFTTTSVTPGEGGAFSVTGDFTLRGVTRPLVLAGRFRGGADNILTGRYTLGFEATGSLSRGDFGIDSLGALVGDEIGIEIHAEFQRAL